MTQQKENKKIEIDKEFFDMILKVNKVILGRIERLEKITVQPLAPTTVDDSDCVIEIGIRSFGWQPSKEQMQAILEDVKILMKKHKISLLTATAFKRF